MKRFIARTVIFCGTLVLILVVGLIIPGITPHQNLHYALIDKHKLLERTEGPRVILVGGSNLAFGIDSKMIRDSLQLPVINTSIHAGLGLPYILEDIAPYVHSGDLVVLAVEYDLFYGKAFWGFEPMISSAIAIPSNINLVNVENGRDLLSGICKESLRNLAKFFVNIYYRLIGIPTKSVYERDVYNEFGDVVKHFGREAEHFSAVDIENDFNPKSIDTIKKFRANVDAAGATLFVTYPCLNKSSYELYPDKIKRVAQDFQDAKFHILGIPAAFSFDDSLYYNSKYHLNKQGVTLRTDVLIKYLKKEYIVVK